VALRIPRRVPLPPLHHQGSQDQMAPPPSPCHQEDQNFLTMWQPSDSQQRLPHDVVSLVLDPLRDEDDSKRTLRLVNRSTRTHVDSRMWRLLIFCDLPHGGWLPDLRAALARFPSAHGLQVAVEYPEALTELATALPSLLRHSMITSFEIPSWL